MLKLNKGLIWLIYCSEVAVFSRLLLNTIQIGKMLAIPELKAINTWFVSVMIVIFAILGVIFITFIFRSLMKLVFPDSDHYKIITTIYLFANIISTFFAILSISLFPNVSYTLLAKLTNAISFLVLNIYFYCVYRNYKESLMISIISLINSSIAFLL